MLAAIASFIFGAGRVIGGLFTGGNLESILKTIDRMMDDGDRKEAIKADVTKKWIDAQAGLLVGRTWWFQLFFVIPLGVWWTAVILDSIFGWDHNIAALPQPLDQWAAWIISALFLVDGTKAVTGMIRK